MLFSDWVRSQTDTRLQVAARIGIGRDGLHKIMRGQVFPRWATRLAIARESDGAVTVDDLLKAFNANHAPVADAAVS
jgi:transcriptional regulator with XRE-family HTH domain